MPVQNELVENGRLFVSTVTDPWTMQELSDASVRLTQIYDQSLHPVHTMVDMTGSRQMPQGFIRARTSPAINHPNAGQLIVTGANILVKTLVNAVTTLAHFQRVQFFSTREEATAFVQRLLESEAQEKVR